MIVRFQTALVHQCGFQIIFYGPHMSISKTFSFSFGDTPLDDTLKTAILQDKIRWRSSESDWLLSSVSICFFYHYCNWSQFHSTTKYENTQTHTEFGTKMIARIGLIERSTFHLSGVDITASTNYTMISHGTSWRRHRTKQKHGKRLRFSEDGQWYSIETSIWSKIFLHTFWRQFMADHSRQNSRKVRTHRIDAWEVTWPDIWGHVIILSWFQMKSFHSTVAGTTFYPSLL